MSRQGYLTSRCPLLLPEDVNIFLHRHCGSVTSVRFIPRRQSISLVVTCQRKARPRPPGSGFGFSRRLHAAITTADDGNDAARVPYSCLTGRGERGGGGGGGGGTGIQCSSRRCNRKPKPRSETSTAAPWRVDCSSPAFSHYRLLKNSSSAAWNRRRVIKGKRHRRAADDRTEALERHRVTRKKTVVPPNAGKSAAVVPRKKRRRRSLQKHAPSGTVLSRVLKLLETMGMQDSCPERSGSAGESREGQSWSPYVPSEIGEDAPTVSARTDHTNDVYVCCESSDENAAIKLRDTIRPNDLKCLVEELDFMPGKNIMDCITDAVTSSRKVVLLLSRQFLQSGRSMFQLGMSTTEMFDRGRALIVPVLLDVTEEEVPPCLRNLSLVDTRQNPNYEHKLIKLLKGPEISVTQLMPAGNVACGLAWSYYFYLRIVLEGIQQRVDDFCKTEKCKDVRMPRKLFILVPASCYCPKSLESADTSRRITFGGHLEAIRRTTAGSVDREYRQTVWTIRKENGKIIQFVGEYCNVAHTMYQMDSEQIAGIFTYQMRQQRDEFLRLLAYIIKQYHHSEQASLVYVEDKEEAGQALSEILEEWIERDRRPPAS